MRNEWWNDAACRGKPTGWWFPPRGAGAFGGSGYFRARRVCERCPVAEECLEDAMAVEAGQMSSIYRHGMYGGLTPMQRLALERERKAETMTYGRIPQEGNRWGYRVEWLSHPQLSAEAREKAVQMMANEICRFGEIPERKSESHRPDRMTLTLIIEEPEDDE